MERPMTRTDALLAEFTRETATARKHLERLPADRFDWRPHTKSYTAGQLAAHIVDCIRWSSSIFAADELDMDPKTYKPCAAASVPALLETFDDDVARAKAVMARAPSTRTPLGRGGSRCAARSGSRSRARRCFAT